MSDPPSADDKPSQSGGAQRFPRWLPWLVVIILPIDVAVVWSVCQWRTSNESLVIEQTTDETGRVARSPLENEPTNAAGWFNRGCLCHSTNNYDLAIECYSHVLRLQKDHKAALLNRAIAELRSQRLDGARKDYQDFLQRFSSTNYPAYYGLGEIAYQQRDWQTAQENYEHYLRFAPSNSGEAGFVRTRLEEVKKEKR